MPKDSLCRRLENSQCLGPIRLRFRCQRNRFHFIWTWPPVLFLAENWRYMQKMTRKFRMNGSWTLLGMTARTHMSSTVSVSVKMTAVCCHWAVFGEKHSGHKGFGLALVVELMTANFAHGNNGDRVRCVPDQEKTCHFFAALDLNAFGDRDDIIRSFSDYLQRIRDSRKADGHDRIYIHGEKELESEQRVEAEGYSCQ